jgi:hypothetical protein
VANAPPGLGDPLMLMCDPCSESESQGLDTSPSMRLCSVSSVWTEKVREWDVAGVDAGPLAVDDVESSALSASGRRVEMPSDVALVTSSSSMLESDWPAESSRTDLRYSEPSSSGSDEASLGRGDALASTKADAEVVSVIVLVVALAIVAVLATVLVAVLAAVLVAILVSVLVAIKVAVAAGLPVSVVTGPGDGRVVEFIPSRCSRRPIKCLTGSATVQGSLVRQQHSKTRKLVDFGF